MIPLLQQVPKLLETPRQMACQYIIICSAAKGVITVSIILRFGRNKHQYVKKTFIWWPEYIPGCIAQIQGGDRGSKWSQFTFRKITKLYGFLAILVRIPRKITKLPSQHSMLGHHRHTSETPFYWRFADGAKCHLNGDSLEGQ